MQLDIAEIYQAARTAGFTPDQATTWTAIALAESHGETGALNDRGEHSVGLWQINLDAHRNVWGDLHDPVANARAAYDISNHGTDMRPWTTTHDSNEGTPADYRTYLPEVSAVTGYAGDGRGVGGYGSPLNPPLDPSGPEPVAQVAAVQGAMVDQQALLTGPGAQRDSDHDGLTDAFERLLGTRVHVADSDDDGLGDAYEVVTSHSDPTAADTDRDTLLDSTEVGIGTSPTAWDTDSDGASDGAEVTYGKNPLVADTGLVPAPPNGAGTGPAWTVPPTGGTGATAAAPIGGPGITPATAPGGTGMTTATPVGTIGATMGGTPGGTPGGTLGATGADPGSSVPGSPDAGAATRADEFLKAALAQRGDSYVFGAEAALDDPDPNSFDCSELTQWAAAQAGVTIPDGAMYQYLDLKQHDSLMPVSEALRTPGALLFYFSQEPTPGGARPSTAHVAISLGDGRTIEARGTSYGVNTFDAEDPGVRFNYAGVIPGLADAVPGTSAAATASMAALTGPATATAAPAADLAGTADPDTDHDGLSDAFERMLGLDPTSPDSDHDGIGDAEEVLGGHDTPLLSFREVSAALAEQRLDAGGDADQDGLTNRYEIRHGLDPHLADTDADGLLDSTEVAVGTDPTLMDSDSDGVTDSSEISLGTDPLTAGDMSSGWGVPPGDAPGPADPVDPQGALAVHDPGPP